MGSKSARLDSLYAPALQLHCVTLSANGFGRIKGRAGTKVLRGLACKASFLRLAREILMNMTSLMLHRLPSLVALNALMPQRGDATNRLPICPCRLEPVNRSGY